MLTGAENLARKFSECFPKRGKLTDQQIANACGEVTKQAVGGWRKTGRIAKKHLPILAELSGRSLEWWLDSGDSPQLSGPAFAQSSVHSPPGTMAPTVAPSPLVVAAMRLDQARHISPAVKASMTELLKSLVAPHP